MTGLLTLVTVGDVREAVLDGLPTLFLADGRGVPDAVIQGALASAQHKVEADLNILIGVHEVRCVRDKPDEDTLADNVIIHEPLDKPKNWFAGDRFGALKLPYRPVKKILKVRFLPYGWNSAPIDMQSERTRLEDNLLRFVPGPFGYMMPITALFPAYQMSDGSANPGAIEVTFTAGLSERDLRLRYPLVAELIKTQAAIMVLSLVQGRVGGGVARESAGGDGLTNAVDLGRVDVLGPLGGILKGLKSNYAELLQSARATLGSTLSVTWL